MNKLSKLDFIGHQPNFHINNKERYQTSVGGILYIIIILLGLAGFINFGKELWERFNPDVNLSQEFDVSPQNFTIDFNNFNLMIGVQNPANSITYINSGIYTLASTFHEMYSNGTIKITQLPITECTTELFGNNDLIKNANIKNTWCLDKTQIKNLTLSGTFGNTYWSSLRFHVIPCRNTTNTRTCLPQEEIDKYMKGAYFSARFINYLIHTKNFTNPYFKIIDNDFFVMSNTYYKELNIYFSNIDIVSDIGFLFEHFETQRIVQLRNMKEQIDFRTNSNDILRAIIRLSTVRNIYNRKYVKIQRLMADVGGLVKTLLMIAQFMYMFYNTNAYFDYIINLETQTDSVERKVLTSMKIPEFEKYSLNMPSNVVLRPIRFTPNNHEIVYNSSPKFHVRWYEALLCYVTMERSKRNHVLNAISTIKEKISIETYLRMISEYERNKNSNK